MVVLPTAVLAAGPGVKLCQKKEKELMKALENKIEDLAGAVLDLENNADEWTLWWDAWKSFLQHLFNHLRYLQ